MTASPPTWGPQTPPGPPATPPAPTTPALWRRPWAVGVAGLLVGIVIGSAVAPDPAPQPRPATVSRPAATTPPAPETTPATIAEPTYRTPKASDFDLQVKVLSKENFGSAGSLVTFRINAGWPDGYDPDKTYEVTYEVRGPEDGPMVNTFTVTGDEYEREQEESASTPSAGTRLTAKVLSVEEV